MPTDELLLPTDAWLEAHRVTIAPVDEAGIIGLAPARAALRSLVGRLQYGDQSGVGIPRAILLHGQPGTGKTTLARMLAGRCAGAGAALPAYDLPTELLTPRLIREAFAILRDRGRSIVLLPEIDVLGLDRRGSDPEARRALFALLEALDGLIPTPADRGPIVVATSNCGPYALDAALLRRVTVQIRCTEPSEAERQELLVALTSARLVEPVDLSRLAALTRGWSPARIKAAVEEACGLALDRGGLPVALTEHDVLEAVRRDGEVEPEAEAPDEAWRVAIHESGHVAVAASLGLPVVSVRIGPGRGEGRTESGVEGVPQDDDQIMKAVVTALAGSQAEELVLGAACLASQDDVRRATTLLIHRVEAGVSEIAPMSRGAWGEWTPRVVDEGISVLVRSQLVDARHRAGEIVAREAAAIRRFALLLLDAGMLLAGDRLREALSDVGWTGGMEERSEGA